MAVVWKCANDACHFTIHEGDLDEAPICKWCDHHRLMVKVVKTTSLDFGQAFAAMRGKRIVQQASDLKHLFKARSYGSGRLSFDFRRIGDARWSVLHSFTGTQVGATDWGIVEEEKA